MATEYERGYADALKNVTAYAEIKAPIKNVVIDSLVGSLSFNREVVQHLVRADEAIQRLAVFRAVKLAKENRVAP